MVNLDHLLDQGIALLDGDTRQACEQLASRLPPRLIRFTDGTPYLTRYYLRGAPLTPNPWNRQGNPRPGVRWPNTPGLYLHQFHASDERRFHNHPWNRAASLILTDGYLEHRPEGTYERSPGDRTPINHDTYHYVELIAEQAWTLFAVDQRVGQWGFLPTKQPATSVRW